MDAQELRIGNWVNHSNSAIWIEEVKNTPIQVDIDVLSNIQYYEPIPLSPEILEKCGFDNTESDEFWNIIFSNDDIEKQFSLAYCGDNKYIVYVRDEFLIRIKYLHHLQNLFYSLSQTELNIKL